MTTKMAYSQGVTGSQALAFRISPTLYEVIWYEQLDNGITPYICRKLKKRTIDFSTNPPSWGAISEIDVATASGYTNPIAPFRNALGYDFDTDSILLALGEWDGSSWTLWCTDVKLLSIKRDFSLVTILQSDLVALAKTVASDVTHIYGYCHFGGYGGKICGALGAYKNTGIPNERSVIALYNGTTWSAYRANETYDYIQEFVEPIWGTDDSFYGWITEGHGTNSHFIKYSDLSVIRCYPPHGVHTTEPVYDPINHKVLWTEWGTAVGAVQYIHTSDPSATLGATNFVDVTPTGTITDNEGNSLDLRYTQKPNGAIFADSVNKWLYFEYLAGVPSPTINRILKVDLGYYSQPSHYSVLANYLNDDKLHLDSLSKAIDVTTKLFVPLPIIFSSPFAT